MNRFISNIITENNQGKRGMALATLRCPFYKQIHLLDVFPEDGRSWCQYRPQLIQKQFPYLKPEEREMLLSGICPDCWDKNMKGEAE